MDPVQSEQRSTLEQVSIELATRERQLVRFRELLGEYTTHLHTFLDPATIAHRQGELTATPDEYLPPQGALLLATRSDEALGCVGLRSQDAAAHTFELCRLYTRPTARGLGLGGKLIDHAVAYARSRGAQAVVLYSIDAHMPAAKVLYLRAGFRPVDAYKQVQTPGAIFYKLDLD
jgi:GNAT superfamily N-acetyltransferase